MAIELIGENKPEPGKARVVCTHCKREMLADLKIYTIDMSKPMRSRCPYCGGELFTALIILTHKSLPELGKVLTYVIQAVEEQVNPDAPDASKTILIGDERKH